MRKIMFSIAIVLASTAAMAQQCPTDSIGWGSAGLGDYDTMLVQSSENVCTPCPVQGYAKWNFPRNFVGTMEVSCLPYGDSFTAQILSECNHVLFDTCGTGILSLAFSVATSPQLFVGGNIGDTILIVCTHTGQSQPLLSTVLYDLDTCSAPLSVAPKEPSAGEYIYFDPYTMQVVRELKPSSTYLKREKFQQ